MTASDYPAPPEVPPSASTRARFCTTCGAALSEQANFCPSCGAPVGLSGAVAGPAGDPTITLGGTSYRLASFGRRLGAALIDGVAWSTVTQVLVVRLQAPLRSFNPRTEDEVYDFLAELVPTTLTQIVLLGLLGAVVFVLLESFGWTPGKAALGLRVLRKDGRRPGPVHGIARYGAKGLSTLSLYLGYLWVLWDPARQAWHDKFASTYVVSLEGAPSAEANTFGPLVVSGAAWAWALLTLMSLLTLSAATMAIATALPRDGDSYRRFFEGLSSDSRPRSRSTLPAAPPGSLPYVLQPVKRIERA